MKIFSLLGLLVFFAGCMNPTSVVKDEVKVFKEKYPDHISKTQLGSQNVQYAWSGDVKKRPLIFVHGSPGSWEGWVHFLLDSNLSKNFHVISVDRPGYGGSDEGTTERSVQKQADAIMEVLKSNQSGLPAILVGHSYGGPVVAKMAMSYPSRIAGVVFVASSVDPSLEKTKWYQYPADWWPIRVLIPTPLKVCNQEIFALKKELELMMPAWKDITSKIVSIQGEEDDLVPASNQDFLKTMIKPELFVEIDRIPKMNHFIPWQRPDLIFKGIAALDDAIKKESP